MNKMKLNIQLFGTWAGTDTASSVSGWKKMSDQSFCDIGYNTVTRNGNTVTINFGIRLKTNASSFSYALIGYDWYEITGTYASGSGGGTGNGSGYFAKNNKDLGTTSRNKVYYAYKLPSNTACLASSLTPCTTETFKFTATATVNCSAAGTLTLKGRGRRGHSSSYEGMPTISVPYPAANITISYNLNGGAGDDNSQTVAYGNTFTTHGEPYRQGYSFGGWKGSNGTTYQAGTIYNAPASNVTLTAQWSILILWNDINAYKPDGTTQNGLKFDLYTSDTQEWIYDLTNEPANFNKEYDTQARITNIRPNVTGAHYTKNSVTDDNADTIDWSFRVASYNVNLYSAWNTYTVKYNANGGTGTTQASTHTYETYKNLTNNGFSRSGYDFLGWNTNSTASSATYSNQQSVKNLTTTNNGVVNLYAIWRVTIPSNVRFTSYQVTSPFTINLTWACTGLNITGYVIHYKPIGGTELTKNCGTSTSTTLNVNEETTYEIWVTATNAGGSTDSSHIQVTTPADQAKIRIYNGSAWLQGKTYIYNGSAWVKAKKVYIYDGSQWKINSNN